MAEYGSMLAVSLLAAVLFLGGWNGPIPIASLLGLTWENGSVVGYLGNFLGMLTVLLKAIALVTLMIWVRWTLPRLRIDQVITTCLKYCTPIAAAMFVGAAAWHMALPDRVFGGLLRAPEANRMLAEPLPAGPSIEGAVDITKIVSGGQP